MVYFIQEHSNVIGHGHIKIGVSEHPLRRRATLAGHSPHPLHLIGVDVGNRDHERELHKRFKQYRVGSSEWFEPGPELTTYLESAMPGFLDSMRQELNTPFVVEAGWMLTEVERIRTWEREEREVNG